MWDPIVFLNTTDLALAPIYFFFILILAFIVRNAALHDSPARKYFIPGMLVKIFGGIGVGLIYGFYYKTGDTFYYYYDSHTFNYSLQTGWHLFFKLLLLPAGTITPKTYDSTWW